MRVFAVKPLRAKDFPVAQTRGEAHRSDLPAVDRGRFYDAIVSSMIEGATPDRESVLLLIDFAAGRIDIDEYRERVLSSRTWRRWGDVADMVNGGPADPDWDADREAIAHELTQADADYAAGKTVSDERL